MSYGFQVIFAETVNHLPPHVIEVLLLLCNTSVVGIVISSWDRDARVVVIRNTLLNYCKK